MSGARKLDCSQGKVTRLVISLLGDGQLDNRGFRLRRIKGEYRILRETTGALNCSAKAGRQ